MCFFLSFATSEMCFGGDSTRQTGNKVDLKGSLVGRETTSHEKSAGKKKLSRIMHTFCRAASCVAQPAGSQSTGKDFPQPWREGMIL